MSKRGKRGVACFSKKYKDEDYNIEFDQNNLPVGPNKHKFVSWFGLKCKQMFPYHIKTTDFERYMWDELWLETKELWKIQSNAPKDTMKRKAKKLCTNFRSRLVTHYINLGKTPFSDYKYLDPTHYIGRNFVKKRPRKNFWYDKSKKARASAKANKNVPRVGRSGYTGMKSDIIWPQLLAKYSCLKNLRSLCSKKWLTSRAIKNKETNKYELEPDALLTLNLLVDTEKKMIEDKSYFEGKEDPLVKVLGREHGGRSRTVSGIIGFTKEHGGLYEGGTQRKVTPCELLFPYKLSMELPLAFGQAWPTSDMTLDEGQIKEGCVKVHVDVVDKDFVKTHVPDVTRTDDIVFVGDTLFNFIQWPRDVLKLEEEEEEVDTSNLHMSSQPQMVLGCFMNMLILAHEQQTAPQNVFVHEPHMSTQSDVVPDPDQRQQMTTTHDSNPEPKFIDPDVPFALEKLKKRPKEIQEIVDGLSVQVGTNHSIEISSPDGMYLEKVVESIPYSEL
ncbi:hypothetical protein HanPI659440_Chr11g0430961 [Helianthus annuus]|nr:hypothetical protein HanPI659440_Chr11g0430961 [Helianthus annuus]